MATISDLYNAEFDAVAFLERYDGGFTGADAPRMLEYSIIHIPGSDTNIVQRSGKGIRELTLPIAADSSEMGVLADLIDTSAALVYSRGTVNARLMTLTDRVQAGNLGIENATLKFILE